MPVKNLPVDLRFMNHPVLIKAAGVGIGSGGIKLSVKKLFGSAFECGCPGYCDQISQWLNDEAEAGRPVDLLILDNLSTLTGFNDSAKSWNTLFSWMKTLKEKRKHPCSVLVVHHSNKKGEQRGTSANQFATSTR